MRRELAVKVAEQLFQRIDRLLELIGTKTIESDRLL